MPKKRKRQTITTSDAIERIDRMVPILYRNVVNAIRIEATLEAGNEVVGSMSDKGFSGAGAYNAIKQSLGYDLAMHLARLYDIGSRRRHPNTSDVASIPLLVRLLRQKRCQDALKARARDWVPGDRWAAPMYERDCEEALRRASGSYSATFSGKYGRSGLKTLKEFRDTFMAHSLLNDTGANPRYNHLFRLTDAARDFVEQARLAATGTNSSLLRQEKAFRHEAVRFWSKALLGADRDFELDFELDV
ncbi:hypothetical protein M0654_12670 [Rhizobium sp. NTR19]|uniref:HEPN AbiU2-like domain-containing protein n=1 Tax=Neorhizobium turbinariae TaxID=2937795 RepID=A0ABT0ISJ5_9HYPH|nr:hypothetical protein [Neorhizobium turbinariae]MCK8780838.1 hypothetical protein [Neorhizobium turbinariae]